VHCALLNRFPDTEMDLRQIGWEGREWIQLAQDRVRWRAVVNMVMNLRVLEPRSVSFLIREWILGRFAAGVGVEWIQLAQDMGRWRALVNTVINQRVLAP
jgi:hypothetical protein